MLEHKFIQYKALLHLLRFQMQTITYPTLRMCYHLKSPQPERFE
jgi:hypothetical protein